MSVKSLAEVVSLVTKGRESAYANNIDLEVQLKKLVEYAISSRDDRPVDLEDMVASELISDSIAEIGLVADVNVGRDLWELVSEDSQAQWLCPPEGVNDVYISLVNVAQNMVTNQCYIEFN